MRNNDLFDTSNYPTDHACHSDKNKKVLGKMKDENRWSARDGVCRTAVKNVQHGV